MSTGTPVYWTAEEVAALLRCDARTVRRKTKTDQLPFIQTASNRMLFDPAEVRKWVEARVRVINPADPAADPVAPPPPIPGTRLPVGTWDGVRRAGRRRG